MKEAVQQGLTSFVIFVIATIAVRAAIHLTWPSFALVPTGENALIFGGLALTVGFFAGLRKVRAQ